MPKQFNWCVDNGGEVRTISGNTPENRKRFGLSKNQFIKICMLDRKLFLGERHFKKVKKVK